MGLPTMNLLLHFWRFREISLRAEWEIVRQAKARHEGAVPQHLLRDDYRRKGLAVEYDNSPTGIERQEHEGKLIPMRRQA